MPAAILLAISKILTTIATTLTGNTAGARERKSMHYSNEIYATAALLSQLVDPKAL
jgi:hypothetical protein